MENQYFNGMADPFHRIQPGDEVFSFLVNVAKETKPTRPAQALTGEMYLLASLMVPGGSDTKGEKGETVSGSIRTYLPEILKALNRKALPMSRWF